MSILPFYLGATALFGCSAILIKQASPFARTNAYVYEKKRKLRLIGQVLLVMAILALCVGLFSQLVSSNPHP